MVSRSIQQPLNTKTILLQIRPKTSTAPKVHHSVETILTANNTPLIWPFADWSNAQLMQHPEALAQLKTRGFNAKFYYPFPARI